MLAIWSLVPLPFLKLAWTSGSSWFTYCWNLAWRILSITLLAGDISLGPIYCGGKEGNATSFKRPHACTVAVRAPALQQAPLTRASTENPGHSWAGLGQSLGVTAPSSWVLVCTELCLCPPGVYFPVLYKFWRLYGGVYGDLLQEGLRHTRVSCTQSPCPWSRPLLTRASTGDSQTQFWLRLCGVSGSWRAQGLFEPSERLWCVWCLILNAVSPLLPSCWGFSPLDLGYLLTVSPVLRRNHRDRLTSNQMSKDFLGDEI